MASVLIAPAEAAKKKPRCDGVKATIVGKVGQRVVRGTGNDDVIVGTGRTDIIKGKGGNDLICGRGGDDSINGGKGDDALLGQAGSDLLKGAAGSDFIAGDAGDDFMDGGPGIFNTAAFDNLDAAVEVDLEFGIATGQGNDTLVKIGDVVGSPGPDVLTGGPIDGDIDGQDDGNGFFLGAGGNDEVNGGDDPLDLVGFEYEEAVTASLVTQTGSGGGNEVTMSGIDWLFGGPANDVLTGNDAANVLDGLEGDDELRGAGGDDELGGNFGNDLIDGGDGADLGVWGNAEGPVAVDLETQTASVDSQNPEVPDEQDSLVNVENAVGSFGFADVLRGNGGPNRLVGLGEGDQILGLGGDDFLDGDDQANGATFAGEDSLDGGDGTDQCVNGESTANCESEARASALREAQRHSVPNLRPSAVRPQ